MPDSIESQGTVGESAGTCILQDANDDSVPKRAIVSVTAANLCRSHAAYASLLVDGDPRASRVDLNDAKMRIETEVHPGEHVVLVVELVDLHNGTMCIRLGEVEFQLGLLPLG